jgi:predicted nuclease with TOPRIM domain
MNIEERINLNKAKLSGIQQRMTQIDTEKSELLQEALRLDGEIRVLNEQLVEPKEKEKGE